MFIQKLQLLVSMGPPGGGRNVITNRLLTKFNVINMTFPAEKQIVRIYGSMLHHHISEFHSEVKGIGRGASWKIHYGKDIIKGLILRVHFSFDSANEITLATIGLYSNVVSKMLPTPGKMHYLFNLRDISKVETSPSLPLRFSRHSNIIWRITGFPRPAAKSQGLSILEANLPPSMGARGVPRLLRPTDRWQVNRGWILKRRGIFQNFYIFFRDRDWFVEQIGEQLGKYFEITFATVCPERKSPLFGNIKLKKKKRKR